MSEPLRVALVGLGYWGPHFARIAVEEGDAELVAREGGVVVNELRQAGFDLLHRVLRKTADSGDYGELLLYFRDGKLVQWGDIRILDSKQLAAYRA